MFVFHCGSETATFQEVEFRAASGCHLPLGRRSLHLVFLAVFSGYFDHSQSISTENMALINAAFMLLTVFAFSLAAASLGNLILRVLRLEVDAEGAHLLICAGVGLISIEMLLFGVAVTQQIRKGCFVVVGLLCVF